MLRFARRGLSAPGALLRCQTSSSGTGLRSLSASAPYSAAGSVGEVIAAASSANPLKDAIKFYKLRSVESLAVATAAPASEVAPDGVELWTYRDVESHVTALSAGLSEIGFDQGDRILTLLPPGSEEYLALVLAAARSGITIVALDPPADGKAVDVAPIRAALEKYQPKGFVLWHAYATDSSEDTVFSSGENSILAALAPSVQAEDARGLRALSRASARPFESSDYPFLKCVAHTGEGHVRGAITFKSMLVYSGDRDAMPLTSTSASTVLVEASNGKQIAHGELLAQAKDVGSQLGLSDDPTSKAGRVVVTPSTSVKGVTAVVSALLHESLLISPGLATTSETSSSTASAEDAVLVA